MKPKLILACSLSLAMAVPAAQAAVLSIDDLNDPGLSLLVNMFNTSTTLPNPPPGGGDSINLTQPADLAHGITNIQYNPTVESLSFTFRNQINWSSNVYLYRYYTSPGDVTTLNSNGYSDLFVIQGQAGTTPDLITLLSSDTLTGNISTDGPALLFGALPSNLGNNAETGNYQLFFDTGVDQYYLRSDIPEPASLALLATGLLGFGILRRRRKSV
jgi:hypothetical protein